MSLQVTGKLVVKGDTQQVTDKFKKREFVLEITENSYTNYAKFQLTQAKCDLLDKFSTGSNLTVNFNIKGNKWEKDGKVNYMTNLEAWKIDLALTINENVTAPSVSYGNAESSDLPF